MKEAVIPSSVVEAWSSTSSYDASAYGRNVRRDIDGEVEELRNETGEEEGFESEFGGRGLACEMGGIRGGTVCTSVSIASW